MTFYELEDDLESLTLDDDDPDDYCYAVLRKVLDTLLMNQNGILDAEFEDIRHIANDPREEVRKIVADFLVELVELQPRSVPQALPVYEALALAEDSIVDEEEHIERFVAAAHEWLKTADDDLVDKTLDRLEELEDRIASLRSEFEASLADLERWEAELKRAERKQKPTMLLSLPANDLEMALKKSPNMRSRIILDLKLKVSSSGSDYNKKYAFFLEFLRKHRYMLNAEV